MNPPHIAIVTYNWPPRNAIGTHRPYSWAKHWSEAGAKITVLTARKYGFDEPLDLSLPLPQGVDVIEVPFINAGIMSVGSLGRTGIWLMLKRVRRLFVKLTGVDVDIRERWVRSARHLAERLAMEVDVVVSTYGPAAGHLIAADMKRSNPRLRWIADYRDLWSQNYLSEWPPSVRQREREKELETVGRFADTVTTVTEEMSDDLEKLLRREVSIVMNGFDVTGSELRANLTKDVRYSGDQHLRIVYTGIIYSGKQDPTPLLIALSNLNVRGVITKKDILVEFYGPRQDGLQFQIEKHGVHDFVRILGHVSREKALQAQREADLLLLLEFCEAGKGMLPGKLFEYIASGTPILSLGGSRNSAIARVLRQCGSGICVEDNTSAIEDVLVHALKGKKPVWFQPVPEKILHYSREFQARQMYANQVLGNYSA